MYELDSRVTAARVKIVDSAALREAHVDARTIISSREAADVRSLCFDHHSKAEAADGRAAPDQDCILGLFREIHPCRVWCRFKTRSSNSDTAKVECDIRRFDRNAVAARGRCLELGDNQIV